MILVTGANGTTGRQVIAQLARQGLKTRAMVRDLQKAKALELPNVEIVKADFEDSASLEIALAGAEKGFLVMATTPKRVSQETVFLKIARQAGIKHIVRLSILGAESDSPVRILRRHGEADQLLIDSGIGFTILRPHYFMQNLLWYAEEIKTSGRFLASLPETSPHSHVDARDIAAVAVAALTGAGHANQIYHLSGPEAMTYGEMMAIQSRLLGQSVYYDASPEKYARSLRNWGLDAEEVLELDAGIARGTGNGTEITDTILRVTKKDATPFEQFANDYLPSFR
jgi:uncharacterized protein YbjT (DUF2867 family)